MVNTCILYGVTSWAGVNILILLLSLMLVAVAWSLSTIFPAITQEKIKAAARTELTEVFIGAIILVILAGSALTACSVSTSMSNTITLKSSGVTYTTPFQYAEYYVGNLSTNTGLNLLTTIYSTSVSYSIEAQVLESLGEIFQTGVNKIAKSLFYTLIGKVAGTSLLTISIALISHLSILFNILSSTYIDVIAPLVTVAIGLLFIQFITLPILQYTAFSIVLPTALALRSFAFLGRNLRQASNAVLAIAIAAYIIYPLMVAFNSYAIAWIFSPANPSYQYVKLTYMVPNIPISTYFSSAPNTNVFSTAFQTLYPFVTSAFSQSGGIIIWPTTIMLQAQTIINETAQLLFSAIVLVIIDIAVTIGFALGLTRALNSGIEGDSSFWSGI